MRKPPFTSLSRARNAAPVRPSSVSATPDNGSPVVDWTVPRRLPAVRLWAESDPEPGDARHQKTSDPWMTRRVEVSDAGIALPAQSGEGNPGSGNSVRVVGKKQPAGLHRRRDGERDTARVRPTLRSG